MTRLTRSPAPRPAQAARTGGKEKKPQAGAGKAGGRPQQATGRRGAADRKVAADRDFWDSQVKAGTMRPETRLYLELKLTNPTLPASLMYALADVATGKRPSGDYVSEQGLWKLQSLAAEPRVKATLVAPGDYTREPLWSQVMNRD